MVTSFQEIWARAADRHGGEEALQAKLSDKPKSKKALLSITDDRWLAEMTRSVFQAGFSWKTIDKKWPGFEEAFEGFEPHRWAFMTDEDLGRLASDARIVRNGQKIKTVQQNAAFVVDLIKEHGSASQFFYDWPTTDFVGLLAVLQKRGSRLGGQTSQYLLRKMGIDGFILSKDGTAALIAAGVIDKPATSKGALGAVQAAYNDWMEESGLPLTTISRTLGLSSGDVYLG